MSPQEKIAKLEGLLARVTERTRGSRPVALRAAPTVSAAPAVAKSPAVSVEPPPLVSTPPHADGPTIIDAAPRAPAPIVMSVPPLPETSGWSEPPPVEASEPPPATTIEQESVYDTQHPTDDSDVDVEVSAEVVEIDIDEPALDVGREHAFVPAESGAQPVAEQVGSYRDRDRDPLPEDLSEELVATATSLPPEPGELISEPPPPPPPANEVIEPEPSSSPRPILTEVPDAYASADEDRVPRHTPPPESGKQVAVPSVKPEPSRKSSVPPPRVSAPPPPLSGGWREPGRVPPAPPPVVQSSVRLTAETTHAATPPDGNVVAIEGTAAAFKPATFGDLLDATLSL